MDLAEFAIQKHGALLTQKNLSHPSYSMVASYLILHEDVVCAMKAFTPSRKSKILPQFLHSRGWLSEIFFISSSPNGQLVLHFGQANGYVIFPKDVRST